MKLKLYKNGNVVIAETVRGKNHSRAISPGGDISDLPQGIQAKISAHWTPQRVADWETATAEVPVIYTAEQAERIVDRNAETERLKYITPGSGQAGVYLQKAAEAKAALLEASPEAANYPLLAASLGIDGATIMEVATTVSVIAVQWTMIAAHIEKVRLTAKKAISDGDDTATVLAGLDWSLPS